MHISSVVHIWSKKTKNPMYSFFSTKTHSQVSYKFVSFDWTFKIIYKTLIDFSYLA
jgi:hypothetical protein